MVGEVAEEEAEEEAAKVVEEVVERASALEAPPSLLRVAATALRPSRRYLPERHSQAEPRAVEQEMVYMELREFFSDFMALRAGN